MFYCYLNDELGLYRLLYFPIDLNHQVVIDNHIYHLNNNNRMIVVTYN